MKKRANLKITVPIRLTRKMWTLIRRRWYLGFYSQILYVLFTDRRAHASKNKNRVVFIDFKRRGGGAGVLALARSLRFRTVLADFPKEKENNVC